MRNFVPELGKKKNAATSDKARRLLGKIPLDSLQEVLGPQGHEVVAYHLVERRGAPRAAFALSGRWRQGAEGSLGLRRLGSTHRWGISAVRVVESLSSLAADWDDDDEQLDSVEADEEIDLTDLLDKAPAETLH